MLDRAFQHLKQAEHRHEYVYKAAIAKKILLGIHSLQTASMLTEFRVANCKADVVILNGTATVYEIKSERDSLTRLRAQIEAYLRVFATVNVIVGENHVESAFDIAPVGVGVLLLTNRYSISVLREGVEDVHRTCPHAIFDSITLREAESILANNGVPIPSVPNTQRYGMLREAFACLTPDAAHRGMVSTLKQTRSLLSLQSLLDNLPESLYSASLSTRLRKSDHDRLIQAVQSPLQTALQWE
ncbi:sce7726 family protein [Botrimarina mediterranea]|uniref:sce7726 family protein n=1 Tax=Botrimarina mediterranea TaxID=2528022 RepID=UPI0018D405C7|nr:sce7726 family protein [Botrimarina mediterranea]